MLYERGNRTKLDNVLLMGCGTFDYKSSGSRWDETNNPQLIPVYETIESLHPIKTYTSDDYFGMLDSTDYFYTFGLIDIGVGRIPVKNSAEANLVVDKIIAYDTDIKNLGNWRNNTVFEADDEDNGLHVDDCEEVVRSCEQADSIYNVRKVYLDAYPQITTTGGSRYPDAKSAFAQYLDKGALVVNFLGHGSDNGWTQERVFTNEEINKLTNKNKLPLIVSATCSFAPHDDPAIVSAGELMLLNPDGGAIALFTTVRAVYANENKALANGTFRVLFDEDSNNEPLTLGEVLRQAKNMSGFRAMENSRKFVLLGDPSMRLAYPKRDVKTTAILDAAGQPISTLKALGLVTIKGEVLNSSGQRDLSYSGTVYPTVYDKEKELSTLRNDLSSSKITFNVRENIIFSGRASVINGAFEFTFVVPKDINYTMGEGRISYYAENGQMRDDGSGYFHNLLVGGTDTNAVKDNTPPEVLVYMNDEQFARGGLTDANPTLLVKLFDESGINTVSNSIGHDLEARITAPDMTTSD